jgi:hypothetical protein
MAGRAHGYVISHLSAPWLDAAKILLSFWKHPWRSDFRNLTMGIPWDEGTNAVTEAEIMSRCDETSPMALACRGATMGVDVGATFDVAVGTRDPSGAPRTICFGRYAVTTCVIDAAPEEHATRAWAARYNRISTSPAVHSHIVVWRASYGSTSRPGVAAQVSWNQETGVVVAPRTEILSRSADELLERRVLPRYEPTEAWLAYIAHHVASKKVPIWVRGLETERVLDRYEWHEVGPDHLFHAATYEMIARQAPHGMVTPVVGLITTRRGKALDGSPRAGVRPFDTPQGGPPSLVGFRRGTR